MKRNSASILVLGICLLASVRTTFAAPPKDQCAFPPGLGDEISKRKSGANLVRLEDLNEYDAKRFQKDEGSRCPGIVRVDFYGSGKPTWALSLITVNGSKVKSELVVARQVGESWDIRTLETSQGDVPMVWRGDSGKYLDVYGEKTIRALHPVIIFGRYEGWQIVYAWMGERVSKVWLLD